MTKKHPTARTGGTGGIGGTNAEGVAAALDHPFGREIGALRELLLAADARVREEVKWNAPSFRVSEHFATFQLRARDGVQVILHFGARKRPTGNARSSISDPAELLDWLADDRASVKFRSMSEIESKSSAFTDVVRGWIAHLEGER